MDSEGEKLHFWNPSLGLELNELDFSSSCSFEVGHDAASRRLYAEEQRRAETHTVSVFTSSRHSGSETPPLNTEHSFLFGERRENALLKAECKICGDRASGYHYGVYACEGCKGFFRRTVRLNLSYKLCSRKCPVYRKSRNKCQFCRFNKCVLAGMSHSAIRFGRTPLVEREKMITEFYKHTHTNTHQLEPKSQIWREISSNLYDSYIKHFPMTRSKANAILSGKDQTTVLVIYDMSSLKAGEEVLRQKQWSAWTPLPGTELELSVFRRLQFGSADAVRRLSQFAKSIPGFGDLELSDQIIMLKYSALEVNIIRLSHMTNKDGVLMADGAVFMTREFIKSLREPFCGMMEFKFDFLTKFRALELEDCDMALFIAALILCGDRPGLVNPNAIEALQDEVLQALEHQLKVLHPEAPQLFAKLLQKTTDLQPLVAKHVRNIHLLKKSELDMCLHPLLLEIMQDLH